MTVTDESVTFSALETALLMTPLNLLLLVEFAVPRSDGTPAPRENVCVEKIKSSESLSVQNAINYGV